ncbi:hypothetical protein PF003_g11595 [Phytophthora fragariae]|nr:hypothetical protein PF003_g11595 [Phytophthora fragariae]
MKALSDLTCTAVDQLHELYSTPRYESPQLVLHTPACPADLSWIRRGREEESD